MPFSAPISLRGPKGAALLTGDGEPTADIGGIGDTYLDLLTGDLYSPKGPGGWGSAVRNIIGPVGLAGARGRAGAGLLNGYPPPADTLGEDGDSYFCQQSGALYGPKADGKWSPTPTSLIGPPGAGGSQGTIIYPVSDVPDDSMGRDGDFAINTAQHTYYGPKFGTWGNATSLVGPRGPVGEIGPRGVAGATLLAESGEPNSTVGQLGDYWLDRTSGTLYGPRTSNPNQPWPTSGVSLRGDVGPEGPRGPAGFMGKSGTSFVIASSDPTSADGEDGDTWFNKASGYIYGPKQAGQWDLTSGDLIEGAPGAQGERGEVGPRGAAGVGFLVGPSAPNNSVGEVGQYYFASKTLTVYGPKDANEDVGWGAGQLVKGDRGDVGPQGADSTVPGPRGLQGVGVYLRDSAPQNAFGQDGDAVLTTDGDLFGPKSGGSWGSKVGSLVGPRGLQGEQGPVGNASTVAGPPGLSFLVGSGKPSATYGQNGDSFFDQTARAIYVNKTDGAWPSTAISLVGQTGARGDTGAAGRDGTDGSILRYGQGAPVASTVAHDGDFYIDQTNSRLYGPRSNGAFATSYVPLIGPTGQPGGVGAAGKDGATIRTGTGAPSSNNPSVQADGDYYFATDLKTFYGPRASGSWPSGTSLKGEVGSAGAPGADGAAGKDGSKFYFDTAEPGIQLGVIGDYFIRTDTSNLYYKVTNAYAATTPDYPYGWKIIGSLKGAVGPSGLSVLTGTGAPAASLGSAGQVYIDTAAYAAYTKSSSGWSAATSLVGTRGEVGPKGDKGDLGSTGPAGAVIYSGSGAPTSSSPSGTITAGSFYIQTDVTPNRLFGPYTAASGWPTSYVAMGGGSLLSSSGPPANSVGSVGDCAVDTSNAFFYPAKTASGWTAAPINLVGPTGPAGFSTLTTQSAGLGISSAMSGTALSTTAQSGFYPGTSTVASFAPAFATQCLGFSITNPGPAMTLSLLNATTGSTILSASVGSNTTTYKSYALGTYAMAANQTYQWQVTGSGTAAYCVTPVYLMPAASAGFSVGSLPSVGVGASQTFSTSATQLKYPGTTVGNSFTLPNKTSLYSVQMSNLTNAAMTFTFQGGTFSQSVPANSVVTAGPFAPTTYAYAVGQQVYWTAAGSGTGVCFVDTQLLYYGT